MIQFNFISENGGFQYDAAAEKFSVDQEKAKVAVKKLAQILLTIQAKGDYHEAKNLINKYAIMTKPMQAALNKFDDIPVDIRPIYEVERE